MVDMKKALQNIDDVIEKGPYKDTWASLSSWQTPKWYQKAKFGIFIHWGVYSVPAFDSEWYPHRGLQGLRAPYQNLRCTQGFRLQRFHSDV